MNTISNNNWSNLPTHKPNPDLWNSIDTNLDLEMISQNIDTLPKHTPKTGLWNSINRSLLFNQYIKYIYISGAALTIAITLFILIPNKEKTTKTVAINTINLNSELSNNDNKTIIKKDDPTKDIDNNSSYDKNKEVKTISYRKDIAQNNSQSIAPYKSLKDSKRTSESQTIIEKEDNNINKEVINREQNKTHIKELEETTKTNQKEITNKSDDKYLVNDNIKSKEEYIIETKQEINTSDSSSKLVEILKEDNTEGTKTPLSKLNIAKSSPEKNWYYSIGIDYSYNVINNENKFTYSDIKKLNQYCITGKITYANWILQTGLNYSSFTDNTKYIADIRLNKYITYNYVDSVIYSPSGNISQYVTHPVTVNNYKDTTQSFLTSKKYSMLSIPLLVGYQWRINKVALTLKTGIQCSLIISEKEELQQQGTNMTLLELYPVEAIIRKTNWAGVVSIELGYNFHKHFGVSLEPILQYYFNAMYREMDSNTGLPYTIGVKANLFYNF
ncbi:MAG: hypothetical protein WCL51_04645 [Bacteroidota bacterium]